MKNLKWILLIVAAFAIGYWSGGNTNESHTNGDTTAAQSTTWTCSMHANVKLPSKGQCPICFMDLIPLEAGIGSGTDPILEMSPSAEKLAEIHGISFEEMAKTKGEVEPILSKELYNWVMFVISFYTRVRETLKIDFEDSV